MSERLFFEHRSSEAIFMLTVITAVNVKLGTHQADIKELAATKATRWVA